MKRRWEKILIAFLHPRHWKLKVEKIEGACGCWMYEWLCFSVEFIARECWRYGDNKEDTEK